MEYYRWAKLHEDGFCVVKSPSIPSSELMFGVPQINKLKNEIFCRMSPDFPDDSKLGDNLYGASVTIISFKLKAILEELITSNQVEYIPLSLFNHEGKVVSENYFILHPLDFCECIDYEKSGIIWNTINPDFISRSEGLVLKKNAIPHDFKLFRLKHWGTAIILRSDVAEILEGKDFKGLRFPNVEGYTGIG